MEEKSALDVVEAIRIVEDAARNLRESDELLHERLESLHQWLTYLKDYKRLKQGEQK